MPAKTTKICTKSVSNKAILLPVKEKSAEQTKQEQVKSLQRGTKSVSNFGTELGLTAQEVEFCKLYTSNSPSEYADHIYAYLQAFGISDSRKADTLGKALLNTSGISYLIDILIQVRGMNIQEMDMELFWICKQRQNLNAKLAAIKLFYEKTGALSQTVKHVHTTNNNLTILSDKELMNLRNLQMKMLENNPDLENASEEE